MAPLVTCEGFRRMPQYLTVIDGRTWMGCARCLKVCSREVMHFYGVDAGEILSVCDGEDTIPTASWIA